MSDKYEVSNDIMLGDKEVGPDGDNMTAIANYLRAIAVAAEKVAIAQEKIIDSINRDDRIKVDALTTPFQY